MSDPFDEVDPNQVDAFLERIARDRNAELARIEEQLRIEATQIRSEAYRDSRRLHRRTATVVRTRVQHEHDRALSRLRAELRRTGWQLIADARERAMRDIRDRFARVWRDPEQRWVWCRFWLSEALQRVAGQRLSVRCHGDSGGGLCAKIEQWMGEQQVDWELQIQDSSDPGIVLLWDDQMLDGRLSAQYPRIAAHLQRQITAGIHEPDSDGDVRR